MPDPLASTEIHTAAIVGVGLIGASFGLALRQAGFTGDIIGVSSPAAIADGLSSGAISHSSNLAEAAASANLIYLAQPVDGILQALELLGPIAPPGCLISDAGSTKLAIVSKASSSVTRATFLGGHPLAGKEQRGALSAEPSLFFGRTYVLTPTAPESALTRSFRSLLMKIGANAIDMTASEHDKAVAFTSHLPQLLSTALANTLGQLNQECIRNVFGPGLIDMTRLALSSPDLWTSILATNEVEVKFALNSYIETLTQVRDALESPNLPNMFRSGALVANALRTSLFPPKS